MNLLLDTHVLIWYAANDQKLTALLRDQINDPMNTVFVSIISCWEIAIKWGMGKLDLSMPLEELLDLATYGVAQLAISPADIQAYSKLGFPVANHRDPFDRMIAVQAQGQRATLVTADQVFTAYLPTGQVILI